MELVDTPDLGFGAARCVSSSLTEATIYCFYFVSKRPIDPVALEEYLKNPKFCPNPDCNNIIPFEKRFNKYCCQSCAAHTVNLSRPAPSDAQRLKVSQTLKAKNRAKIKRCKYCGLPKREGDHFVCKKLSKLLRTMIKFGFDTTKLGTIKAVSEFYRIKDVIENFYEKNAASYEALINSFNYTSGSANFLKILKSLDIKVLSHSEAAIKYLLSDRANSNKINSSNYNYKDEWHTTWNNKKVYLRSSYETDFANELDECKIDYEVESLRIKYFDTQKEKNKSSNT